MNKLLIALLSLVVLSSCGEKTKSNEQNTVDPNLIKNNSTAYQPDAQNPEPQMTFEHMEWNFGTIKEGATVSHTFKFTNTGNEELVITSCKGSCGCTTPVCDQQPVPPGGEGKIKVKFDSENRKHNINKQVTIIANTNPPTTILNVKGYVKPIEEQ